MTPQLHPRNPIWSVTWQLWKKHMGVSKHAVSPMKIYEVFFIKTTLVHFEVPSPKYLADLAVIFQTLPAWSGAGQAAYCRWSGHEGLVQFCMGRVRSSNSLSSKESVHYTSGMCSSKYQVWSGSQSLVPLDKIWFWWGSYCAILVGRDIRQALQNTQPWHRVSKLLPFGSQQGCFWFLCRNMVLR